MKANENNNDSNDVKTFISSLPDTEKELKILLNHINVFNNSGELLKINVVGNNYVKSILNSLEPNDKLAKVDTIENKDKDEFHNVLDTDSFTHENVDYFINIIANQIEDLNYPETNLKKDFDKACKLDEDDLFEIGTIFYVSSIKSTLLNKIDSSVVKKANALKKDMDSKVFTYEYDSLEDFDKLSQEDINEFGETQIEEGLLEDFEAAINSKSNNNSFPFSIENSENDPVLSLLEDGIVEEFFSELDEKMGGYGLYDDAFTYLENVGEELDRIEEIFYDKNQPLFDDPNSGSSANKKFIEKLSNYSKGFSKCSNEFEQNLEENRELRRKVLDFASLLFNLKKDEEFLEFIIESKNGFEELCGFVDTSLVMLIENFNAMFSSSKIYGKHIEILNNEFIRILDNFEDIKEEMDFFEKKFLSDIKK